MAVGIIQVAAEAGVSKSTVSRVLSGASASESSIDAVARAVTKLGYTPNHVARAMRGKRDTRESRLIAAAPELLAALKRNHPLRTTKPGLCGDCDLIRRIEGEE